MNLFLNLPSFKKRVCFPLALFIAICCLSALVTGQEAIPKQTLNKLKAATVYIRVSMGPESGSGSGFLFKKDKRFAYIITNEHVVKQEGRFERTVEVDFFSGTAGRKALPAIVLSEDESRDLAVLKVPNKNLPEPINLKPSQEITETEGVYILGFPFGGALATNERGPNVTIGRGTISSIRTDDWDSIEHVQIDGDINPGNSGGPIVFADGSLMGVSVATVIGTNIGIGIPGESVLDMLEGRIGSLSISQNSPSPKRVVCNMEAQLIDPMGAMRNISVLYIDPTEVSERDLAPDENGRWSRISSKMKEARFEVEGQAAVAELSFRGDYGEVKKFIHQIKFVNGRGEKLYTGPGVYTVRIPEKNGSPRRREEPGRKVERNDRITQSRPPAKEVEKSERKKSERKSGGGWLGANNDDADEGGEVAGMEPVAGNRSVAGEQFDCLDASCVPVNIDASATIRNLVWDSTHEHFFVLSAAGMMRKISFPDLIEVATLDIGSKCIGLDMSETGLCVLNQGMQDLLIINPETLEVQKRFAVGKAGRITASPATENVVIAIDGRMILMNSRNGAIRQEFRPREMGMPERRFSRFSKPALSPDGKYLLCEDTATLVCFRFKGERLVFEARSKPIARNSRSIEISSDSSYVAIPAGGGNGKGYTTHVFEIDSLQDPVIEVQGGAYPQTLEFDKAAGLLYAQNSGSELLTINGDGRVRKSYDLRRNGSTLDLLVHPDGHKVLVMTETEIISVELPDN